MNHLLFLAAVTPGGLGGLRLPAPRPERPGSPDPLGEVQARTLRRRARKGDPDAAAELVRRGER